MDMGRARAGMTVAEKLRRKRKITNTPTRAMVRSRVNFTSPIEARMV